MGSLVDKNNLQPYIKAVNGEYVIDRSLVPHGQRVELVYENRARCPERCENYMKSARNEALV
jgi:hypothetical protein